MERLGVIKETEESLPLELYKAPNNTVDIVPQKMSEEEKIKFEL